MKKLLIITFAFLMIVFCGCKQKHNYDYSDWKTYELPNEHTFMYPQDWKCSTTENGLLYFYTVDDNKTETVTAFQSHIDPCSDTFDKSLVEKNAYYVAFQGIQFIHNETGYANNTMWGVDLVMADNETKSLRYVELNVNPHSRLALKGGYDYKFFFSEDVSDETFQQILESCD